MLRKNLDQKCPEVMHMEAGKVLIRFISLVTPNTWFLSFYPILFQVQRKQKYQILGPNS